MALIRCRADCSSPSIGPKPAMDTTWPATTLVLPRVSPLFCEDLLNNRASENDAGIETEVGLADERFVKSRQDSRGLKYRTTTRLH